MNREVFALLSELGKPAEERTPARMKKLADHLISENDNELKQLYRQYLEENPELDDSSSEPDNDAPESLRLTNHDQDLLKNLLGRT